MSDCNCKKIGGSYVGYRIRNDITKRVNIGGKLYNQQERERYDLIEGFSFIKVYVSERTEEEFSNES